MFKHILVATDGSDLSLNAVRAGARLAQVLAAKLTAVCVMIDIPSASFNEYAALSTMTYDNFLREMERKASEALDTVTREAQALGVSHTRVTKRNVHAYEGIIEAAVENGCDLIVMASHGRRGVSALVLGSETHKVLTHSKIPVLVFR